MVFPSCQNHSEVSLAKEKHSQFYRPWTGKEFLSESAEVVVSKMIQWRNIALGLEEFESCLPGAALVCKCVHAQPLCH